MNTKHTAGPWNQFTPAGQLNVFITGGKGSSHLATVAVSDCTHDREEDEANARLIAAAPELLAALIEAESQLSQAHTPECESAAYGVRAAIAKATS